ncbi:MAG: IPT/TIG domain-containing protein [Bryobacteraceae bacterium]
MPAIRKWGVALAWLICSAAMAHAQTPTTVSAIVNSATKQITITGTSLTATGASVVKLDSATLTLVSSASTQIVANLPAGIRTEPEQGKVRRTPVVKCSQIQNRRTSYKEMLP